MIAAVGGSGRRQSGRRRHDRLHVRRRPPDDLRALRFLRHRPGLRRPVRPDHAAEFHGAAVVPLAAALRSLRFLPHGAGGHAASRRRLLALRPGGQRVPAPDGHARGVALHGPTASRLEPDRRPLRDGGAAERRHRRHHRRHDRVSVPQSGSLVKTTLYTYMSGVNNNNYSTETNTLQPYVGYWIYAFQPVYLTYTKAHARVKRVPLFGGGGNKLTARRIQRGGEVSPPRFLVSEPRSTQRNQV